MSEEVKDTVNDTSTSTSKIDIMMKRLANRKQLIEALLSIKKSSELNSTDYEGAVRKELASLVGTFVDAAIKDIETEVESGSSPVNNENLSNEDVDILKQLVHAAKGKVKKASNSEIVSVPLVTKDDAGTVFKVGTSVLYSNEKGEVTQGIIQTLKYPNAVILSGRTKVMIPLTKINLAK